MGQPAARLNDPHTCPMVDPGPIPHVGFEIVLQCSATVLIGGEEAARVGDMCRCNGPLDPIVKGSSSVFISGQPAARQGDMTGHGGVITNGCATVLIGGSASGGGSSDDGDDADEVDEQSDDEDDQGDALENASAMGSPFCLFCQPG